MLKPVAPRRKHQDGMASVEMVPIILLFAMLFNFTLGFFGIIHSGILNSIAARNYAFETFRNRANLVYLRDDGLTSAKNEEEARYTKTGFRFHGIISESNNGVQTWIATRRPIRFTDAGGLDEPLGDKGDHTTLVRTVNSVGKVSDTFTGKTAEEGKAGVNPVWLQTLYGICLNSTCSAMK